MSGYRSEFSDGAKLAMWCLGIFLLLAVGLGIFNLTCGATYRAVNEAQHVAQEEFGARGLLEKYRYFKRVATSLSAKAADIAIMEKRVADTRETYGKDAARWPRDVREQVAQDRDALYSLKASFNQLAADYNAAMADGTKAFMNRGDWPKGWPSEEKEPLKREFAEYRLQ